MQKKKEKKRRRIEWDEKRKPGGSIDGWFGTSSGV